MLRLLELPDDVLLLVQDEKLSMGHARALLGLENEDQIPVIAQTAVEKELSVREIESLVRKLNASEDSITEDTDNADGDKIQRRVYMKDLEDKARTALGRKVKIRETGRKKTVEISFEDDEDLENLLKSLVGQDIFE